MDKQINRANWSAFTEQFSQENQNRPVRIEQVNSTLGDETVVAHAPLVAVDFDKQAQGTILITVGQSIHTLTHSVTAPHTIWLQSAADGKDLALEVLASDESKTILQFEDIQRAT